VIREGAFADLVLLDPETVIDARPSRSRSNCRVGIERVFVNGELVWEAGKPLAPAPAVFCRSSSG